MERLRQEALDAPRTVDGGLILHAQLVHAEHGDDVLQVLILLQHALHGTRGVIVAAAENVRLEDTRRRAERVDSRVDAELGDGAVEHGRGVEVGKRRGGGGVGQVVGGDVDRLHGRDRAVARGGDALLKLAHLGRKRGLIADGGGHTAEQCRHLAARLREAEDVVDEQQHVLSGLVAEILRDRQTRQRHAQTRSGRLVHLAEDERGLADDAGLVHLVPEVVALARALTHAGKDGVAAVLVGNVADELHDEHGLAHARAAEQTDLAALGIGREQVDDLDAGLEQLGRGGDVREGRGLAVDGQIFRGVDRAFAVDRLTDDIEHAAERRLADGHFHARAGVDGAAAALQAVGGKERDAAHRVVAELLHRLHDDAPLTGVHLDGVVDLGQLAGRELHVHHRADDPFDDTVFHTFSLRGTRRCRRGVNQILVIA